jgi:CRP-like cAMP-binding protein
MVEYYQALAAILLMECQQTAPAHEYEPESETASTAKEGRGKACTVRERVQQFISEESRDYHGRRFEDIYITAPKLADVLGCSNETARRRLNYFESQGVVEFVSDARSKHYIVAKDFTATDDEIVRSAAQITDAAQAVLHAAEEN